MNPVVHFELPYEDRARAERFYAEVFGWKTHHLGPDRGDYVLLTTAESDVKPGAPAGAISGGMFPRRADCPAQQHPSLVIAVQDLDRHMELLRAAGGATLGEPISIPEVGRLVGFTDSEGNRLSMLQPLMA